MLLVFSTQNDFQKMEYMKPEMNSFYFSSCSELILIKIFSQNVQTLKSKQILSWETKNMLPQAIVRLCCQKTPFCLAILTREYDDEQDTSRCTKLAKMTEIKHKSINYFIRLWFWLEMHKKSRNIFIITFTRKVMNRFPKVFKTRYDSTLW